MHRSGLERGPEVQRLIAEADELRRILAQIIVNTKHRRAGLPEPRPAAGAQ